MPFSTFFRFIRQEPKAHTEDGLRALLFSDSFSFHCGPLVSHRDPDLSAFMVDQILAKHSLDAAHRLKAVRVNRRHLIWALEDSASQPITALGPMCAGL